MVIQLSIEFVNKSDDLYNYALKIPEIEGYETVVCHGGKEAAFIYTNEQDEISFSAEEFAERLRNSSSYKNGNIRLISCHTGANDDGFAQRLADELNVVVMAPTEAIWVNSYGEMFISNYDVLADRWFQGDLVNETGKWRIFHPRKEDQHD